MDIDWEILYAAAVLKGVFLFSVGMWRFFNGSAIAEYGIFLLGSIVWFVIWFRDVHPKVQEITE